MASSSREHIAALSRRYAVRGPRYTSYPTAADFRSPFPSADWQEQLTSWVGTLEGKAAPISLYVHIPFCKSLCYFCACNKIIAKDRTGVSPYLQTVAAELDRLRVTLPDTVRLDQLHFGGGSPSFLQPEELAQLAVAIRSAFPQTPLLPDWSVEFDPRTTSIAQLERLHGLGFNRVSYGVQDFHPEVQRTINRWQPFEMTRDIVAASRTTGYESVNIDLIYGLPTQSREGFRETVERVIELAPDRIALYGYAHVTWRNKVQRAFDRHPLPDPEARLNLFLDATESLQEAGYVSLGMDHFALPSDRLARAADDGTLGRNFMGYTTNRSEALFGLGVSAISAVPGAYAQNEVNLPLYQQRIADEGTAIHRGILRHSEDQLRGWIIDCILCRGLLDEAEVATRCGRSIREMLIDEAGELEQLERDGIISFDSHRLVLTPIGRMFSRNVAMLFDAYLPAHRQAPTPVFSAAV